MPETTVISDQILNSWKEIARYLNRGVRTVQRWEAELGLPVRRPRGRRRSAVIAMRSEIDEWLNRCPLESREGVAASSASTKEPDESLDQNQRSEYGVSELILGSRLLRRDLDRSQQELVAIVQRLMCSIETFRDLLRQAPAAKPPEEAKLFEIVNTPRVA
jgi:hypothetical protein